MIFSLALVSQFQTVNSKSMLVFSGGGIRAAVGAISVIAVLQEKKLLDKIDIITALSGGTWGTSTVLLDKGDALKSLKELFNSCEKPKDTWGDFNFARLDNAKTTYTKWVDGIKKYFLKGESQGMINMKLEGFPETWFFTDKCEEKPVKNNNKYLKMSHTEMCIFNNQELFCTDFKSKEHNTQKLSNIDSNWKLENWLAASSDAWAEVGRATGGYKHLAPPKTASDNQFCDPGAFCNLPIPMQLLKVKEITDLYLFDFSATDKSVYDEIKQCSLLWSKFNDWEVEEIKQSRKVEFKDTILDSVVGNIVNTGDDVSEEDELKEIKENPKIKQKISSLRNSALSIKDNIIKEIDYKDNVKIDEGLVDSMIKIYYIKSEDHTIKTRFIPFYGSCLNEKLINKYPTQWGFQGTLPKWYTCDELHKLIKELYMFYFTVIR